MSQIPEKAVPFGIAQPGLQLALDTLEYAAARVVIDSDKADAEDRQAEARTLSLLAWAYRQAQSLLYAQMNTWKLERGA